MLGEKSPLNGAALCDHSHKAVKAALNILGEVKKPNKQKRNIKIDEKGE